MTQVQIGAAVEPNPANPTGHLGKCDKCTQVQTGAEDKLQTVPESVLTFITAARWKATQRAKAHEYTHRDWGDVEGFYELVKLIRAAGYDGKFQGRKYRYLNVGEFTYWTMGAPLEYTIIINRRRTENQPSTSAPTARPAKRRGRVSYPTDSGRRCSVCGAAGRLVKRPGSEREKSLVCSNPLCSVTIQPSVGRLIGEPNQGAANLPPLCQANAGRAAGKRSKRKRGKK